MEILVKQYMYFRIGKKTTKNSKNLSYFLILIDIASCEKKRMKGDVYKEIEKKYLVLILPKYLCL